MIRVKLLVVLLDQQTIIDNIYKSVTRLLDKVNH